MKSWESRKILDAKSWEFFALSADKSGISSIPFKLSPKKGPLIEILYFRGRVSHQYLSIHENGSICHLKRQNSVRTATYILGTIVSLFGGWIDLFVQMLVISWVLCQARRARILEQQGSCFDYVCGGYWTSYVLVCLAPQRWRHSCYGFYAAQTLTLLDYLI